MLRALSNTTIYTIVKREYKSITIILCLNTATDIYSLYDLVHRIITHFSDLNKNKHLFIETSAKSIFLIYHLSNVI